jgi:hypothetical protein
MLQTSQLGKERADASVEETAARNDINNAAVGVSALRALGTSACTRISVTPKHATNTSADGRGRPQPVVPPVYSRPLTA